MVFSSVPLSKNIPKTYQKYIQIYSNIFNIYQDIPRHTKYPRGRSGRGGLAAAWYFVYLGISWYILAYLGYIIEDAYGVNIAAPPNSLCIRSAARQISFPEYSQSVLFIFSFFFILVFFFVQNESGRRKQVRKIV